MKKLFSIIFTIAICVGIVAFGAFYSYRYFAPPEEKPNENIEADKNDKISGNEALAVLDNKKMPIDNKPDTIKKDEDIDNSGNEKIEPSTKMIYEYHYSDDKVEKTQEEPPYYMIGKNKEDMVSTFSEWEIVSFSSDEVVMRKSVEGTSKENYVISVKDGYVAVFYTEAIDGTKIKEITDTPISALPKDEQDRLIEGISISGEDALVRLLEDYGS